MLGQEAIPVGRTAAAHRVSHRMKDIHYWSR